METSSERNLLPMSKKQELFKIKVERTLENKIRRLCKELPTFEWSGALFYTYNGTIKDKNMEINAKDLYLMDIGSAAYTEFKKDPNIISYMIEKGLLDCEVGLIHSHDQMATFFSGTDLSTLQDEGTDMHHFVSLIVNNAGEYCAAITCQVENEFEGKIKQSALTFNDEKQLLKEEPYTKSAKAILYWNMDVTVDKVNNIIEDEEDKNLVERLEFIKAEKAKKREEESKKYLSKWSKWPDRWGNDWDMEGVYTPYYSKAYKQGEFAFANDSDSSKSIGTRVIDNYNATTIAAKILTLNPCCTATSIVELKLQIKKNMEELTRINQSIENYGTVDSYFEAYIDYILDRFGMYEVPGDLNEKEYGKFLDTVEMRFDRVLKIMNDIATEFPNLEKMINELITLFEFDKQCAMEM